MGNPAPNAAAASPTGIEATSSSTILFDARYTRTLAIGTCVQTLVIIASIWGRWPAIAIIVAAHVVRVVYTVRAERRAVLASIPTASLRIAVVNMVINLVTGTLGGWSAPALIFIPLQFFLVGTCPTYGRRLLLALTLGAFIPAWACGVPLYELGLVAAGGIYLYRLSAGRSDILDSVIAAREAESRLLEEALDRVQVLQENLVQQDKLAALGVLSAGIAHEINNPMTYVTANVDSLMRDFEAMKTDSALREEYAVDVLPAVLDGVQRVNAIVADLRRFARGEPECASAYDLNSEVRTALRISQGETKHACRLETDLGDVPLLHGRPRQIGQVLVNLVVNAAQATARADGLVRVVTRVDGDDVLIEVIDCGQGIAPDIRSKLFDPFFTTKPVGKGTGLGLAVAHGLVRSHGGTIDVSSMVGAGTTFTVRLPVTGPQALLRPAAAAA